MRVLVTGSSGRVGRRLVSALIEHGHGVVGLDMKPPGAQQPNFRYVEGSITDEEALRRAADDADAVIHLSTLMSWSLADADRVFSVNVEGTFRLMQALLRKPPQRLIFVSSGEVYPENNPRFLPLDEHHPTMPMTHYGLSKLLGEEIVWFYARRFGFSSTVLRLSHTQDAVELLDPDSFFSGPRFFLRSKIRQQRQFGNQRALAVLEPLDDGQEKLLLSRGEDGTPYRMAISDTRDIVRGILLALESPRAVGETIGLGPDEAVCFETALPLMQKATGLPLVEARLPGPAVNYHTSNAKARELLGYRPAWDFVRMLEEAAAAWKARHDASRRTGWVI